MKSRESFFSVFCMRAFTFTMLAVGMAGCGGGGSGGSPAPTVVISSANAPAVAGAAIQAGIGAANTPLAAATSTTSYPASTATTVQTIGNVVTAEVKKFDNQSQAPAIATGVSQSGTCPNGGTVTINGSGSSGTITYSNCSNVAGYSESGTISISNAVSNASGKSANVVLNLTMISPTDTLTIQGDIAFAQTATTLHMSGNSLTYTSSVYGTRTVQNYSIDVNLTTGAVTESFSLNNATLGVATVAITTPFTYATGTSVYPNAGVATVTGANSTKLRITILGDETAAPGSQVKLEVSTDGGSTYGTPIYVDWATLTI